MCPSCDREIKLADCRRIFPTELPEDLSLENLSLGNEPEILRKYGRKVCSDFCVRILYELIMLLNSDRIEELTCEINQLKAKTKLQENKIAAFESGRRIGKD